MTKIKAIAPIAPDRRLPPLKVFYYKRSQEQRWSFFTRREIYNQDTIASLYAYAANVIDIKACLADDDMNTLMFRAW